MAEPQTRRVNTVGYYSPYGVYRSVNIRANRTEAETSSQYNRIYNQLRYVPDDERGRQFARLQRAYTRVMGGLAATGRSAEWASELYRLRRNNRA